MIASVANDDSEEARSNLQRWTVELQDAEESLSDSQRDRYLADQQKILDRLYNSFETYVDNRMEQRDKLLEETKRLVTDNQKQIKKEIITTATELNAGISATMKGILKNGITDDVTVVDSIKNQDINIKALKDAALGESESLNQFLDNYNKDGVNGKIGNISSKIDSIDTNITKLVENKQLADSVSKDAAKVLNTATSLFTNSGAVIAKATISNPLGGLVSSLLKRPAFASGTKRIGKNQYAWTQEKGLEAIVRQSDGAILTPLARNDSVLNAAATQNIWDMANNPMKFIKENSTIPNLPTKIVGGDYDIQQSMVLTLPNVKNYDEFVSALQKDKKFEQMMQDMTINQLTGGSQLAKYKYNYK